MTGTSSADIDLESEAAEEVRAYLVALRGGAPFLSGGDGRLLVRWLDAGVPVPVILAGLDAAAERRRKRALRTRLSLNAAKGEVERLSKKAAAAVEPVASAGGGWAGLGALADELEAAPVDSRVEAALGTLVATLRALAKSGEPEAEAVARQAIAAVRGFHEAAWDALEPDRPALLAAAEVELAGLRDVLSAAAFDAAAEEVARDKVRGATPLVAARVVWDRLVASEEG